MPLHNKKIQVQFVPICAFIFAPTIKPFVRQSLGTIPAIDGKEIFEDIECDEDENFIQHLNNLPNGITTFNRSNQDTSDHWER